jgi:hypothetical protein
MNDSTVQPPDRRARFCSLALGLVSAWVLLGAVFKLFWGTPALLPKPVIDFGGRLGFDLGLTYRVAIGMELAIVAVALLRPRLGWWALAALMVVFDVVLGAQIAAGETKCGCFGASFSPSPKVMLALDTTLLMLLLVSRPWSSARRGLPIAVPVGVAALGLALPWFFDRELESSLTVDGQDVQVKEGDWMVLDLENWVGKEIWDTPLAQQPLAASIDVNALALDGLWVFWRATCDHCKEHLIEMKTKEQGQRLLVLVQLEEKTDTLANRVVHELPDGNFVQHATLPPSIQYVLSTPGELLLEGGKIVAAKEGVTSGSGL